MFEKKEATLSALRSIILEDDRALNHVIEQEVATLKDELLDPTNFAKKVDDRTDKKLADLKQNFGVVFKKELQTAVQRELKDSQDEVINALYPIIGKLIKKYIQAELEALTENIDDQISNTFSFDTWVHRVKAFFSGSNQSDIILAEMAHPTLEEIFMIQNGSGLLIGSYSKNNISDKDMVAGMLSAISSFVEDALAQQKQSLNTIEYENYKILIQDFPAYKLAFVVGGVVSTKFKEDLADLSFSFVGDEMKNYDLKNITDSIQKDISDKLEKYFIANE